jgi:hypothetical protein
MNARCFLALALLVAYSLISRGADGLKPSAIETKDVLHTVITGQLAAFRAGDYAAAYMFADREIKSQLPLERFEQMVKLSYPAIAHSVLATFGLTFDNGAEAAVNVRVSGADESVTYQYLLRRDGNTWRITGVVQLKDQTTEV